MTSNSAGARVRAATWQNWMDQWAELIASGMPVLDALTLSRTLQHSGRATRNLVAGLQRTEDYLRQGQSLQTAFRAAFGVLPMALEISLMCAQSNGDLGGALQVQLKRWQTSNQARLALGKSLSYPLFVLLLSLLVWIFLHQVSKPHLGTFTHQQAIGSDAGNFLLAGGFLGLALALLARFQSKKHPGETKPLWPHQAWATSNFYHVVACELQAGLDLMHCLRHRSLGTHARPAFLDPTRKTTAQLNALMQSIQRRVKEGEGLSTAMQQAGAPDFLVSQSRLAEQTGNLAHCFFLAARVYDMQARDTQQRLQTVLPPLALALAALTLALAYQSTLAPLYNNLTGLS